MPEKDKPKDIDAFKNIPDTGDSAKLIAAQESLSEDYIKTEEQFRKQRDTFSVYVRVYIVIYASVGLLLVIADAWKWHGFDMPDSSITALVGGVSISALLFIGIIVRGLFFRSKSGISLNGGEDKYPF